MYKQFIILSVAFMQPIKLLAQSERPYFKDIKKGTFYFHSLKANNKYIITRDSSVQQEINLKTGDTSFWKVNWINDYLYNLKFIRSTQSMSIAQKMFFHSHIAVIKILEIKRNYYVFKSSIDSIPVRNTLPDTLWFMLKE